MAINPLSLATSLTSFLVILPCAPFTSATPYYFCNKHPPISGLCIKCSLRLECPPSLTAWPTSKPYLVFTQMSSL